ncbi:hypothetical protein KIW84_071453 [Lathyrus oleraceus]|uniref:CCHC-type domain-containing protein n=1 Tax=Pisum sativum TaxID=3888 RepID=A0A9D4ZUU0_PEA|nr:hypothetical protein KIW84_071453 [Pisum sativum]
MYNISEHDIVDEAEIWHDIILMMMKFIVLLRRKSTFQKTYSHIIYLTNGLQLWPVDGALMVNPLVMRMVIGHPKNMRNNTNDEPKNPRVLLRKLVTITCHKCGSMGHNMRTCKGNREEDRVIPKDGNKTKKSKTTKGKVKNKKSKSGTLPTQEVGSCSQGPQTTQEYDLCSVLVFLVFGVMIKVYNCHEQSCNV